jgi:ATP-dependent Lon protease
MNEILQESDTGLYPVLPLRDVVVYPYMVIPLFVGREKSVRAIEASMASNQKIILIAQKTTSDEVPTLENMYQIGTLATILQLMKLPDGTIKVLVEGEKRVMVREFVLDAPYISGKVDVIEENILPDDLSEALRRTLMSEFEQYVKLNKKIPPEAITSIGDTTDIGRISDTIIAHMTLKIDERQIILELTDPKARAEKLVEFIQNEIEVLSVEKSIRTRVKKQMDQNQKEYYLNEQMKAIQSELGEDEDGFNEIQELEKNISESKMSAEAESKAKSEIKKLKMMPTSSAEATVVRNYIDTLLGVPWRKRSRIRKNINQAEEILNEDHYSLEKIKERILEYLAVQQRMRKLKGPILCLVGPPGVGKTSLGESIARATGRKFIRMALGGVRDEAEIRGHRRTYIGSMPGQIIQKMTKSGVKNPLFLLDEIDKMSTDFRGDPASAMLEVLDPEQNHSFNDHYLEVDYDLSDVMFVATANSMNIPSPLLDRMEIIHLSGYTEDEKLNIARKYLIPRKIKDSGLKDHEITINDSAIKEIIRTYTREAGVRSIEREIAKICRKVVKQILMNDNVTAVIISDANLEEYLGVKKFRYGVAEVTGAVGQVTGLAWTQVGGELLTIEAAAVPGKGKVIRTGKLGEVMQESIQAALTVVRSLSDKYNIPQDFHEKKDLHIHVPEGATPKDGPSAGVAMCTALISVLTDIPVRHDIAMTGEITLRGEVLPIGGLKEKLLAALRGGIKTVLIPHENERDLKEIPENVKMGLKIIPVKWIDEVLKAALEQDQKGVM